MEMAMVFGKPGEVKRWFQQTQWAMTHMYPGL